QPLIQIQLKNVKIYEHGKSNKLAQVKNLTLPSMVWPDTVELSTTNLRRAADASNWPTINSAATALDIAVTSLIRDIIAQLNVRAASAVSCLLLLVLGAVMASWLVGQMPLVVYMWAFLTAIITILIINTGRHMTSGTEYTVPVALGV